MWSNICNSSLSITSITLTNFQAEMYFHIKKSDKDANNISLTQYIERNNCFMLSVERRFEGRLCKTLHKGKPSAATKRNISRLQSLSLKDKDNTDEVNSGNSKCTDENIRKKDEKMEEELWTLKLSVKKKLQSETAIYNNRPNLYISSLISKALRELIQIASQNRKLSRRAKQTFKLKETLKQTKILV